MTTQFSLGALWEYITFCAILAACSAATGVVAAGLLMLFALSLMTRQGLLALIALSAAVLACGGDQNASYGSCTIIILLAALLCGWYSARRTIRLAAPAVARGHRPDPQM